MSHKPRPLPIEVDVWATKQLLDSGDDILLLDCREQAEYDLVHIAGATLVPLSVIQQRLEDLEPHRGKPIIVYCHVGGRSLQVTHWLRQLGYPRVQNMTGGIDLWAQQIDPALPRYA